MKLLIIIAIVLGLFIIDLIVFSLRYTKKYFLDILINLGLGVTVNYAVFRILEFKNIADQKFFLYMATPVLGLMLLIKVVSGKPKLKEESNKMYIELEHEGGKKIRYDNPYNGFLVYGGAEAGKTSSVGKPLLKEYMRNGFGLFIYDAKESDYAKVAMKIKDDINYSLPIYNIDFFDPRRSYRTNIFHPSAILDDQLVPEFAYVFFTSQVKKDYKKDQWFSMALGTFKAVSWVFFKHFPEYCSLPHICNFIMHNEDDVIEDFIKIDNKAIGYGGSFLSSEGKTRTSIKTTVTDIIGDFASNVNSCYILSGNDFPYTPLDPDNPKCIAISNHFVARATISPLVVLMFLTMVKQIRFGNKIPFAFFLDEATTFTIPDLESYPSELREYLIAFVMLTQSPSKLKKLYGEDDRASFESNLANQFYGWTADINAIDIYAKQFSKKDEKTKSVTTGGGRKSRSTTVSIREKVRFDGEFFGSLKPGEFVGKAKNANVKTFHTRFAPYKGGSISEMPIIRNLTKEDIESEYNRIIDEVKNTVFT